MALFSQKHTACCVVDNFFHEPRLLSEFDVKTLENVQIIASLKNHCNIVCKSRIWPFCGIFKGFRPVFSLRHGSVKLPHVMRELSDGVRELRHDVPEASDVMPELNDVTPELRHDVRELRHDVRELWDGARELRFGLPEVEGGARDGFGETSNTQRRTLKIGWFPAPRVCNSIFDVGSSMFPPHIYPCSSVSICG
ncbi:MAG TPA: hypothetical protein VMD27_01835 [Candidatus Aquilonibacter sp.]|nr:hypothetical protein [Candidatus Aquilonibacter sp.]